MLNEGPVNFLDRARADIRSIKPYKTAESADDLAHKYQLSSPLISLASNENPFPPSDKVIKAITSTLKDTRCYPDPNGLRLKLRLASRLNVSKNNVSLGNGSAELLMLLIQAYAEKGDQVIISQYAYALFETCIKITGASVVTSPAKNWGHDLQAMKSCITNKTKLIVIANPNNPTGTYVTHDELERFIQSVNSNIIIVIDEAYYEYITVPDYPNTLLLQRKYHNIVITRTFSKVYSLAGLRVGYAISHEDITDILNRIRLSFNVSSCALAAASEAICDDEFVKSVTEYISHERNVILNALDQLNLSYLPATANFITFMVPGRANEVFEQLIHHGLLIRQLNNYHMPDHLRISLGSAHQNKLFIDAMKNIVRDFNPMT